VTNVTNKYKCRYSTRMFEWWINDLISTYNVLGKKKRYITVFASVGISPTLLEIKFHLGIACSRTYGDRPVSIAERQDPCDAFLHVSFMQYQANCKTPSASRTGRFLLTACLNWRFVVELDLRSNLTSVRALHCPKAKPTVSQLVEKRCRKK